jgi:hypothetical protein
MRILINHLTRMHGGHICVAGIDLETRRHIRPVLANEPLPFYLLARYRGPFDMATMVDLGSPRAMPVAPHVEDHVFVPTRAKATRLAAAHEFWSLLEELQRPSLREIFGDELEEIGRGQWVTKPGCGSVSLGLLRPAAPPELFVGMGSNGKPRVRLRLKDNAVEADMSVTDIRLFGVDHETPQIARISAVAQWLRDSRDVILGVGLTRQFRTTERGPFYHWLQVTNIHLPGEPTWRLG